MDSPALPMDIKDINVCLLSAKKTKSVSSPSLRHLDQMSLWWETHLHTPCLVTNACYVETPRCSNFSVDNTELGADTELDKPVTEVGCYTGLV